MAFSDVARSFSVYIIVNTEVNKAYVGLTVDVSRRYRTHWNHALRGNGWLLHAAMRKYGKNVFIVKILKTDLTRDEAAAVEIQFIRNYQTRAPQGYNLTDGGDGALGYRHSDAWKTELSRRQKGRSQNPDAVARMRITLTGRSMPNEFKLACKLRQTGTTHSIETKQKMRKSALQRWAANPKIVTVDEALRLRTLAKGRINTKEHNDAIRQANAGVPKSEEAKENMRKAALARWALRKAKIAAEQQVATVVECPIPAQES